MSVTLHLYDRVEQAALLTGLGIGSAKLALLSSAYTPDAGHTTWADVSAHEVSGVGYTAGGMLVGGMAVGGVWDADDATFVGLHADVAYGILYTGTDLIGYISFSAGAEVSSGGHDFIVRWSINGIIKAEKVA